MHRMLILVLVMLAMTATTAGAKVGRALLYYEDAIVRTIVPPARMSQPGVDDLYVVIEGVAAQLPVAAVAPGDRDYHGGKWAFHAVAWNVEPYLLTSAGGVIEAAGAGDVTITRVPENDFKCPIQPLKDGVIQAE